MPTPPRRPHRSTPRFLLGVGAVFGLLALAITSVRIQDSRRFWKPGPYHFTPAGVFWTHDTSTSGAESRVIIHWPADVPSSPAPTRDPECPRWAAWPSGPGIITTSFARGWPLNSMAIVDESGPRLTLPFRILWPEFIADWLVLWALSMPLVVLLEAVARGADALGIAFDREFRRKPDPMLCPHCRYDLRGLPAGSACPECGQHAAPTTPPSSATSPTPID